MEYTGAPLIQTSQNQTAFGIIRIKRYWVAIPSKGNLPLTLEEGTLCNLEEALVPQ